MQALQALRASAAAAADEHVDRGAVRGRADHIQEPAIERGRASGHALRHPRERASVDTTSVAADAWVDVGSEHST